MKALVNKLKSMEWHISAAESCTGGLVAKMITDVPGASAVFDMAVTTYSNDSKMKLLGVKAETLETFGAVSEPTAKEMATGIMNLSGSDIAISVTGLAGPNSDDSKKAVGTVCIGIATKEKCYATTFLFTGSRAEIRRLAARMACRMALEEIGGAVKHEKIVKTATKKTKKAIGKLIKKEKTSKKS